MINNAKVKFVIRCANHRWFNTTMIRRRDFDGHIASTPQSGRHWLIYMLSLTMAEVYGKKPPETIQSQDFVGNPKTKPIYPELPQLSSSHSLPHGLMYYRLVAHNLKFPKYLIVVRDMRHGLVSCYEKWKKLYQVDFSTYLKSSVFGARYHNDIWRQMQIMNEWGRIAKMDEYDTLVLKYEDLKLDPAGSLRKVCHFFDIDASDETIGRAVIASSKEEMKKRSRPRNKKEVVVRDDPRHPFEWFSASDRKIFNEICTKNLKCSLGYDYSNWNIEN